MKLPLAPYDVHLWLLDLDTIEPAALERYRALMTEEEQAQEERLRFPGGRERHRCTRALVRTVLSRYTGTDPRAWTFRANAYGKPDIAQPAGTALQFNLSHSGKLILCAVTRDAEIGVDVEKARELPKAVELARRFFAPQEASEVKHASADRRSREFLRFWTFKESYVKARGVGLLVPLDGFFFKLPADAPPSIDFTDAKSDDPASWQFAEIQLAHSYQMALAIRRAQHQPMNISVRRTVPLCRDADPQQLPDTPLRRWKIGECA